MLTGLSNFGQWQLFLNIPQELIVPKRSIKTAILNKFPIKLCSM